MSRSVRIGLFISSGLALLLLLIAVVGVTVVRSQWFYGKVRERIVFETERATGGRVAINSFSFDWSTLTATIRGFTVHGTEVATGPPLFHAEDVVIGLKVISIFKRDVDIALVKINRPSAYLLVDASGSTNIPTPKKQAQSNKTTLETILDLAIQHFEVTQGSFIVQGAEMPRRAQSYSAKGDNLRVVFTYDVVKPRYHGDISLRADLAYGDYAPIPTRISTTIAIEKNQVILEKGAILSDQSQVHINGRVLNFNAPVITAEYGAHVSIAEAGSVLRLKSRQSGMMDVTGNASFKTSEDYALSGYAKFKDLAFRGSGVDLRGLRGEAKIDGGPRTVSIDGIRVFGLGGDLSGKAIITDFDQYKVNADLRHFDARQVAALALRQKLPYDAALSGPVFAQGRIKDLKYNRLMATARLSVSPASNATPVRGLIDAKYNPARQTLDLGNSFLELPHTRLDFSGVLGRQLKIHFASTDLGDLTPALEAASSQGQPVPQIPLKFNSQGSVAFDGAVNGALKDLEIAGHISGTDFSVQGQTIDSAGADITASKSAVTVDNGQLRQGKFTAEVTGSLGLRNWRENDDEQIAAKVSLRDSDLQGLFALVGQKEVPVSGTLNMHASVSGTVGNPQATAELVLLKGAIEKEPFDRITAHLQAPDRAHESVQVQLTAGRKQVRVNASFEHSANQLLPGQFTFDAKSNEVYLNQIVTLRAREPDLEGRATLTLNGSIEVRRGDSGKLSFQVSRVNADATANALRLAGRTLGDLHLTAETPATGGPAPVVQVHLRSNLAETDITGDGSWTLAGDYPGKAKLKLSKANLDVLRRFILTPAQAEKVRVGGTIEAALSLSGPLRKPDELQAQLEIPNLEVQPLSGPAAPTGTLDLTVRNSGPIKLTLANDRILVEDAHLVAQDTDFRITGNVALAPRELKLQIDGNVNLKIIQLIDNEILSSGAVAVNAGVTGNFSNPQFSGSIALKNANLAIVDVPNGLSNVNGTINFSGSQARIQQITAETGGGKLRIGGFASLNEGLINFRLFANASGVRVRYPEGVSTIADGQLRLVGNTDRSVLSGAITVQRLAFNPRTDLGSLLSSTANRPQTPATPTGFLGGLSFDMEIQTAPDISFESGLAQGLEADANLRLRGNITSPVLLGRINITQGEITFFGNTYTINQGSIAFYNPIKMEPILNVDLETVARGVDVTITLSGPASKLNVSYRSDPPLQFSDIVALLATGRTPTDPTLAARQSTASQQNWQQMGASALVGQAIASPVAGRLQRFFGVSRLKIDPSLSSATGNPQAKVTLEQQITPDITFTYITDVANAQEQLIRIEWAFSKTWSAVALRDENGEFGIDFLYKKRFR